MTTPPSELTLIVHLQSASLHLREISVCAQEMERMLEDEKERVKQRVAAAVQTIVGDENREIFYEDAADEWERFSEVFPNLVRSAFFAKSASAFETLLLASAKAHQHRQGMRLTLADLRGDGIQKAQVYFTRVAELDFPAETDVWSDIAQLAEIRNCVIHNDSKTPPDKVARVSAFVQKRAPEILCDSKGAIRFKPLTSAKAIEIYDNLIREFIKRLGKGRQKAQ